MPRGGGGVYVDAARLERGRTCGCGPCVGCESGPVRLRTQTVANCGNTFISEHEGTYIYRCNTRSMWGRVGRRCSIVVPVCAAPQIGSNVKVNVHNVQWL